MAIKSDRAYRREYHAILKACSDFGFSDTEDVPLSAIVRAAFVQMKHEIERRADTEGDRQELIDYAEARAQALSGWPITEDHHLDIQCDDGRLVYVGPAAQAPLWALVAYLSLRIAELTSPPLGSEAAADGDASPAPPEGIAHEWRFDTIIGHYRCNRCLARDDGSHGPTCPKAILPDPPVQP